MNLYEKSLFLGVLVLLFSSVLIVPLINGVWRFVFLRIVNCPYKKYFSFNILTGLTVMIDKGCFLSYTQKTVLLIVGYAGNIILGCFLYFFSVILRNLRKFCLSIFISTSSSSFLFSISYYFFVGNNDVTEFFNLIGIQNRIIPLLIGFFIFLISLFLFWENLERTSEDFASVKFRS